MGNTCVSFKIDDLESNNERKRQFLQGVLLAIERWTEVESGQYRVVIQKLEERYERSR